MVVAAILFTALHGLQTGQPLRSRKVEISPQLTLSVFEVARPASLVEQWSSGVKTAADPFGVVLWPGALYAARRLAASPPRDGETCLVVGAGTGLEALTAASLGSQVVAVDINPLTLNLLADAAREHDLHDRIETRVLDLTSDEELPDADVHVYADTLYTRELCDHVARRCREELWSRARMRRLLLTTSQQFEWIRDDFLAELNVQPPGQPTRPWQRMEWQHSKLENFTGSGILLEEDQSYDAKIRYLDVTP